jgi:uncharacterized protein (DUF58 family)
VERYGPLLDSLVGLSWPARRLIGTGTAGSHPSRLRGNTSEFTEYRLYRQGDDPRRLDWKLLARTDRAYLRITDDHAIRTTLIVLDASASMAFPEDTLAKWIHASRIAVGLAAVARGEGDPVGLVVAGESGLVRLPPRSRHGVIGDIARAVDAARPHGRDGLAGALQGPRPGWRVVLISDFLGAENALRTRAASLVVEGVEVFAIHVVAEDEVRPPPSARLATDPEDPAIHRVLHGEVLGAYTAGFDGWRSELATRWRAAGTEYTEVRTSEDVATAIRRIVRPA